MGLVIRSSASAVQQQSSGAFAGAVLVAGACIEGAGLDRAAIDVLINTGIYKDSNQIEPALAAFIQRQLGINTDPLKNRFGRTTFSFDLSSGRDCFLHAVQVIDALAGTGAVQNALVVASSAASVMASAAPQSHARVATAALLERSDSDERGFHDLAFYCDDDADPAIFGHCDPGAYGPGAAEHVTIEADGGSSEEVARFLLAKLPAYLSERHIDPTRISFALSNCRQPDFGRRVTEATGIRSQSPTIAGMDGHSAFGSGLMVAWDAARKADLLAPGTTILVVEGGPGPIATMALYRC